MSDWSCARGGKKTVVRERERERTLFVSIKPGGSRSEKEMDG
jgi:hypothetical protein